MRIARGLMVALLLTVAPGVRAAEPKPVPNYDEVVAKLQAGNTSIDFQAFRFAYAETPDFDPNAPPAADKRDLIRAVNSGDLGQALDLANTILAVNYTDIDAHYASFLVYDQRGDQPKAELHRLIAQGLLKSFTASGDGTTEKTPIVVVAASEEYSYLGLKGFRVVREGLVPGDAGPVAAFAVTTFDNQSSTIYFDISRMIAKMKPSP
jgi:hypothetical protein